MEVPSLNYHESVPQEIREIVNQLYKEKFQNSIDQKLYELYFEAHQELKPMFENEDIKFFWIDIEKSKLRSNVGSFIDDLFNIKIFYEAGISFLKSLEEEIAYLESKISISKKIKNDFESRIEDTRKHQKVLGVDYDISQFFVESSLYHLALKLV